MKVKRDKQEQEILAKTLELKWQLTKIDYLIVVLTALCVLFLQKSPRLPHVHGEIAPPCRTTAPLHKITENL